MPPFSFVRAIAPFSFARSIAKVPGMSDYDFFVRQLRFVAGRTDRDDPEIDRRMRALEAVADRVAEGAAEITVPAAELRDTARALAGMAGLFQQALLPEVVAAGDPRAEAQVRWTIDTCMEMMAALQTHADLTGDTEDRTLPLPQKPGGG